MVSLKAWRDHTDELAQLGVRLPRFDVDAVKAAGAEQPVWMHFGGGNLYRALHAEIAQDIADAGKLDRGVVVAETFSPFTIDSVYAPFDNDILQVIMNEDGSLDERVLAVTADALFANPGRPEDFARAQRYFESPELQMVTFTITEKGYAVRNAAGELLPFVAAEIEAGPAGASSTMGIVASLLLARFNAGAAPIAMVSTDNFSRNGERFRTNILTVVDGWTQRGLVPAEFAAYVSDETRVSFPWTMIDRITPNPAPATEAALNEQGIGDLGMIESANGIHFAGFANTEAVHYLVVEDSFPNGRPELELGGVIMCDRETAERADTMKVTTCLNPLHTCLAVFGCLLGYHKIADEMTDPDLVKLIRHIGYDEGLPVVVDPGVIDPKQFIDQLLERRLPNPSLPDTPQRIAADTSQKIPVRYGETIKSYIASDELDPATLTFIPLTCAGWLRYLLGVDDEGNSFAPSPDPMLAELTERLAPLVLGCTDAALVHDCVAPILSNAAIFGADLYRIGLGAKVERFLIEMLAGTGAVAKTIAQYV